jgi:hypothetical protein
MDHDPTFLAATINPRAQCWCGSGKRYDACHRRADMRKAEAEIRAGLEATSSLLQTPFVDRTKIKALFRFHCNRQDD